MIIDIVVSINISNEISTSSFELNKAYYGMHKRKDSHM